MDFNVFGIVIGCIVCVCVFCFLAFGFIFGPKKNIPPPPPHKKKKATCPERAANRLNFYLREVWQRVGLVWTADNETEIREIVKDLTGE